jgi:hypothetical protein
MTSLWRVRSNIKKKKNIYIYERTASADAIFIDVDEFLDWLITNYTNSM